MGIREASEYFFLGGGGVGLKFPTLGPGKWFKCDKMTWGDKGSVQIIYYYLSIICVAPFLCPYQPHPPSPVLNIDIPYLFD